MQERPVYWSEQKVFEVLRSTHFIEGAAALLPQVRSATGAGSARTADAIAMQLWPSRGLTIEGVEIKTDRRDFLRELAQPEKSDEIARYCSKWWIAAPEGVVTKKDIEDSSWPVMWGWLEVGAKPAQVEVKDGKTTLIQAEVPWTKVRRTAKENEDVREPSRLFLASLMRSLAAHESPEAIINRRVSEAVQKATKDMQLKFDKHAEASEEELKEIRIRVQQFEYASNINTGILSSSWDAKSIQERYEESRRLLQIARSLDSHLQDAKDLADELTKMGDKIIATSERMKRRGERLRQFIAEHTPQSDALD